MRTIIIITVVVIVGLVLYSQSAYAVDQTEQVLVTRFQEIKDVKQSPGLYFKTPFVDTVAKYDNRLLGIDTPAVDMLDIDKQALTIDAYTRYRITDPVQFFKTLRTEVIARDRLGAIVTSSLRAEIANSTRARIIGGDSALPDGTRRINEQGIPTVIPTNTRSEILERVLASVRKTIAEAQQPFGVEVVDVRIKRADFPGAVAPSIYTRMRAERTRIASQFRAEGDKQDLKIRADVNRRRDIILAQAERDSNILRGEGEGEAIRIFAEALQQDPEFYSFRRSLDAYRTFLSQHTTIVLSADSDLFRFLQSPLPASTPPKGK